MATSLIRLYVLQTLETSLTKSHLVPQNPIHHHLSPNLAPIVHDKAFSDLGNDPQMDYGITFEFRGSPPIGGAPLQRKVMRQLIHIARLANSPIKRLMFACPIAIPTLVNLKFCIGELVHISKTSAM